MTPVVFGAIASAGAVGAEAIARRRVRPWREDVLVLRLGRCSIARGLTGTARLSIPEARRTTIEALPGEQRPDGST